MFLKWHFIEYTVCIYTKALAQQEKEITQSAIRMLRWLIYPTLLSLWQVARLFSMCVCERVCMCVCLTIS